MEALKLIDFALMGLFALLVAAILGLFARIWKQDKEEAKWILFGIYMFWMLVGWVPGLYLSMSATTHLQEDIGLSLFVAYFLSWLVSACVLQ